MTGFRRVLFRSISWVRLFIANRAGIFGEAQHSMKLSLENRQLYIEQVKNYIDRLGQLKAKGAFEIQQSQSYDDIREITVSYEEDFKKAKSIFLSDNWRVDLQQLKNTMSPLFEETWENIRLFELSLGKYARTSVNLSQKVTNRLNNFVWGVGAIFLIMMLVTYFLFDTILRRPILQVAKALDEIGRASCRERV